jgi:hypothetical protein
MSVSFSENASRRTMKRLIRWVCYYIPTFVIVSEHRNQARKHAGRAGAKLESSQTVSCALYECFRRSQSLSIFRLKLIALVTIRPTSGSLSVTAKSAVHFSRSSSQQLIAYHIGK